MKFELKEMADAEDQPSTLPSFEELTAEDFVYVAVINEASYTPVFPMVGRIWHYACHYVMFIHLMVVLVLLDIITYPFRCFCGLHSGRGRLLLRFQARAKDASDPSACMTDIDLGPSIHAGHRILEVVMPGKISDPTEISALRTLLKMNDATGFTALAKRWTPAWHICPQTLEPGSGLENVKAVLSSMQQASDVPVGSTRHLPEGKQEWAQVILEFHGNENRFFCEYQASSWLWYCAVRYPFLPLGIFFIFFSFLSIMADIAMAPLAIIWNYSKKAIPGNEIRLHLFTVDQGGEGVEHKTEGFTAVLCKGYTGPSFTAGFNKCCRGQYQRWAWREIMRTFYVPQDMHLYRLHMPFEGEFNSLQMISSSEMLEKLQEIQLTCSCCC